MFIRKSPVRPRQIKFPNSLKSSVHHICDALSPVALTSQAVFYGLKAPSGGLALLTTNLSRGPENVDARHSFLALSNTNPVAKSAKHTYASSANAGSAINKRIATDNGIIITTQRTSMYCSETRTLCVKNYHRVLNFDCPIPERKGLLGDAVRAIVTDRNLLLRCGYGEPDNYRNPVGHVAFRTLGAPEKSRWVYQISRNSRY